MDGSSGRAGLEYQLHDVEPPTVEEVERACAYFRAVGLKPTEPPARDGAFTFS